MGGNSTKMKIVCKCGKEVERRPCLVKSGRAKYCSQKCKYKYRVRPTGLKYKTTMINKGWFKFKGGGIDEKGYRRIKKRREHIMVMEKYLGRKLYPYEVIHHLNGNRQDNRIENLSVIPKKEHDNYHLLRRYLE